MLILLFLQSLLYASDAMFFSDDEGCKSPPPSMNFTNARYSGLWYEIGKMQTAGGAAFEKDCVCTTIDIQMDTSSTTGDGKAINSCRKLSPTGSFLNATGSITDEGPQGKWKEGFFPLAPKASYTIIYIDDNYAIEYDCTSVLWMTNYCIHLLSRTPTMDAQMEQKLIQFSTALGLNTEKLPYQKTLQTGCWS